MNRVLSLLGFARKSGNLVPGETLCRAGIQRKKISLLIIATDINASTDERMTRLCEAHGVNYRRYATKHALSVAIGKANYGLLGISSKRFTRALIEAIDASESEVNACPKSEFTNWQKH